MENSRDTYFIESVVEALKKSTVELEKFQVNVALGKAEAKESFEEIKKKLNLFLHESNFKIQKGKEKVNDIHGNLDQLRVQLSLGKAETIDAFNDQKRKLLLALHELEVKIKSNEKLKKMYAIVLIRIDMFKVQLEILEMKFNQDKIKAKVSFEKGKQEFNKFIDNFKRKHLKQKESRWEHAQAEVSEALFHLKKAFSNS